MIRRLVNMLLIDYSRKPNSTLTDQKKNGLKILRKIMVLNGLKMKMEKWEALAGKLKTPNSTKI